MRSNSFGDDVLFHLGPYKKEVMRIVEKGEYNYKGVINKHHHILPRMEFGKNILPEYRKPFFKGFSVSLHRYFHHLKSS